MFCWDKFRDDEKVWEENAWERYLVGKWEGRTNLWDWSDFSPGLSKHNLPKLGKL